MFSKLYNKLRKGWLNLSQKRRVFYSTLFSIIILIILAPLLVRAKGGFGNLVAQLLGSIVSTFLSWLSVVINWEINIFQFLAQFNNFLNVTAVREGWKLVRDVCNMFFIIILLVISFATILRIESYAYKKWLGKLVIAAILINFSKTITGLLIGFSQVVMLTFVSAFKDAVAGNLGAGLHLNEMMSAGAETGKMKEFSKTLEGDDNALDAVSIFGALLLALILLLVFGIVLLVMIVVLVGRIISLWVLVILSPVAYLLQASPFGEKYAKQWWQELGKNLVAGPVLAFFLWLSFLTIQRSSGKVASDMRAGEIKESSFGLGASEAPEYITGISKTSALLDYIITIALLIAALKITQEMGVIGSSFAGKMQQNMGSWGKKATVGLASYLDRKQALGFGKVDPETGKRKFGTGIQFGKLIPHALEGLKQRKIDEETKIRKQSAASAQKGGLLAIPRGISAGPEAAKRLLFKGAFGIPGLIKAAQVSFGDKDEYKRQMQEGEDQKDELKKDHDKYQELILNINSKEKEEKLSGLETDIKDLQKKKDELKKELEEGVDSSGKKIDREEQEGKITELDNEIKEKEEEITYVSAHSMVLEKKRLRDPKGKRVRRIQAVYQRNRDRVMADNTLSTKDKQDEIKGLDQREVEKLSSISIRAGLEKKEKIGLTEKYFNDLQDLEEEKLPTAVENAKKIQLEKELKLKESIITHNYQSDKDDTSKIEAALTEKKKADQDYLTAQREEKLITKKEYKRKNKEISEDKDGVYKFNEQDHGQVESYLESLRRTGLKEIENLNYLNFQNRMSPGEYGKKLSAIKSDYGLGGRSSMIARNAKKEIEDKGKINRRNKEVDQKYEDQLESVESSSIGIEKQKELIKKDLIGKGIASFSPGINLNNFIKELGKLINTATKDDKKVIKEKQNELKELKVRYDKNEKERTNLKIIKEKEKEQARHKAVAQINTKGINRATKTLEGSLDSLSQKIEKISVPKSLSARIAERSLVEEKKREFSGIDDAGELLSYLKSAINNKDVYKTRALLEKMASDGNDNEFLNGITGNDGKKYVSNAIGMESFRQEILKGKLKMGEQGSLQVLNDIGYINEKIGHWETARLVDTNSNGDMSAKVVQRVDGSWDDTKHAFECFAEISKMNGRTILNTLNRLAYGGEKVRTDGSGRDFEISNLGKMILTMLNGDKDLLAKRGSELNINAAQNFMNPNAKKELMALLGEKSKIFKTIMSVSGEMQGVRSDYETIYSLLKNKGRWS